MMNEARVEQREQGERQLDCVLYSLCTSPSLSLPYHASSSGTDDLEVQGKGVQIKPFNIKFLKAAQQAQGGGGGGDDESTATGGGGGGGAAEKEKEMHPTTIFVTGLLDWKGGESELRSLFESQCGEGAKVLVSHWNI